jgi:hypothetical protein
MTNPTKSQLRHRKLKEDAKKTFLLEKQVAEMKSRIELIQKNVVRLNHSIHANSRRDDCMKIYYALCQTGDNADWKY